MRFVIFIQVSNVVRLQLKVAGIDIVFKSANLDERIERCHKAEH